MLWALVEPLLPKFEARPQVGGTAPVDDLAVFTAGVFVLTSGCAWRTLPSSPDGHVRKDAQWLPDWRSPRTPHLGGRYSESRPASEHSGR